MSAERTVFHVIQKDTFLYPPKELFFMPAERTVFMSIKMIVAGHGNDSYLEWHVLETVATVLCKSRVLIYLS